MLAIVVQLGQPGLCGYDAAAQGLDTSINGVLTKPNLKILHIGNSFTFDTTCYLPEIVKGTEADVSDLCIYRMMLSSASFKDWYDTYNDIDIHSAAWTMTSASCCLTVLPCRTCGPAR